MALHTGPIPLFSPAPIAIHDHSHMLGKPVEIQLINQGFFFASGLNKTF
jgi:hypothetical protein